MPPFSSVPWSDSPAQAPERVTDKPSGQAPARGRGADRRTIRPNGRPDRGDRARRPVAISDALASNDAFAALREGVARLQALETDIGACLPAYLCGNVSPAGTQDGTLTLLTPHNALAARLRHLAPTLVSALQARGWQIEAIKVRIRPVAATPPPQPKTARISPVGLACLDALRASLEPSPLKDALETMVSRHGRHR
ncbi:DciA family protein [Robbsia andropogonis]|uniref:DciA family protein n=1 Tax=Robbsia andropogonis TaxID=28092 RepID=UPI0004B0E9D0|nr:DciA family protein [Robbsia andropogonis]MCP1118286.1 DciA family protein [Robbsia andropogonis]MCP1127936.1 DciA family protein [Robbsia andropogonis]